MAASEVPSPPRKRGTATTVRLVSGGTVTVTLAIDLFSLSNGDREFVLSLIDSLAEYAKANVTGQLKGAPATSKAGTEAKS